MNRIREVTRLRALWKEIEAGTGKVDAISSGKQSPAQRLTSVFGGFNNSFQPIEVYERYNFIRPEIPTAIWQVWVPMACLDADVLRDYQDWPRRALPEDRMVQDLTGPEVLFNLPRDDRYRLTDVVNVERRSTDRQLQSNGFLAGEVDLPPDDSPWWAQYLPWIGAGVFIMAGALIFMLSSGD